MSTTEALQIARDALEEIALAALSAAPDCLPPLPMHPEHTMAWTNLECESIRAYGRECAALAAAAPSPATPLTPLQATAPRQIWLQISDNVDHHAEPFPKEFGLEITWCASPALGCEVAYVRADLALNPIMPAKRYVSIDRPGSAPLIVEAQGEVPTEPSDLHDDRERDEFYRVFNESTKLTGHQPTLYDIWLMARGRMDTNHRTLPVGATENCTDRLETELAQARAAVPEIDYEAAIAEVFKQLKVRPGQTACIAFARGAEWFREIALAAAPNPPAVSDTVVRIVDDIDAGMRPPARTAELSDGVVKSALDEPGCERLRDFSAVGPVQRAAVEAFADAILATASSADARDGTLAAVTAERDALLKQLNTPELHDFARGVVLEAAHQRERWGSNHDAGKAPADWFWLLGYLASKALNAHIAGNTDKALHHTISSAAALANWHAAISGTNTAMRPGIDPVARGIEDAAIAAAQAPGGST